MSIRLGVLLPHSRKKKIKIPDRISKLCERENIELVDLDPANDDLYEKGQFDVFLHDVKVYYKELNPDEAASRIQKVKDFCSKQNQMAIIDNIERSVKLSDRVYQTNVMESCEMASEGIKVFVPKIVEIAEGNSIDQIEKIISSNNIKFPILAKPTSACLKEDSHDMKLIFSLSNISDLTLPCLIQEFCNHGGVVYKVYVVGDDFNICEKPSIQDVNEQTKDTIYFDTRDISKLGKSFRSDIHSEDPNNRTWLTCDENPNMLNRNVVGELCRLMRKETGLYLLGMDILKERETGNYALIDVNSFPGYTGIDDMHFPNHLVRLIKKLGSNDNR